MNPESYLETKLKAYIKTTIERDTDMSAVTDAIANLTSNVAELNAKFDAFVTNDSTSSDAANAAAINVQAANVAALTSSIPTSGPIVSTTPITAFISSNPLNPANTPVDAATTAATAAATPGVSGEPSGAGGPVSPSAAAVDAGTVTTPKVGL